MNTKERNNANCAHISKMLGKSSGFSNWAFDKSTNECS